MAGNRTSHGRARRALVARVLAAGVAGALPTLPAWAQKRYDPGASDKEIKIGNTMPYSGPASAYGTMGKAMAAYFEMVNAQGGVNGRKIRFLSLDDGFNPAKTVEQTRKLVEDEEVLLMFGALGTATNNAVQKYLNQRKIPQLFVAAGATHWGDHKAYPWTMGWQPTYASEARSYVAHLLETHPRAKVAILYQNDDGAKDYVKGFEDALGDKARAMIVASATHEVTDPTVESQILSLKASGADVLFTATTPKFAAQVIRRIAELGWKPQIHYLSSVSASVGSVLKPAGLDNSVGVVTGLYLKDPTDPAWADAADFKAWTAWMRQYYPAGDLQNGGNVSAYALAATLTAVLRQCGDDLTRGNVMKQAASLGIANPPMLLPGIGIQTSVTDYYPVSAMQLARFDGKSWVRFGRVYGK